MRCWRLRTSARTPNWPTAVCKRSPKGGSHPAPREWGVISGSSTIWRSVRRYERAYVTPVPAITIPSPIHARRASGTSGVYIDPFNW